MIPIQFKYTVARKYGYKHFQELLGVYFKCTKTIIQAMKDNNSTPLSSGEKEPLTLDKCFAIEQAASKALSEIHKITTLCADEHEENIFRQGFHYGVLSKLSSVDTNMEEKKAEEIVGENIPSFKEAAERYANLIHHVDPLHHEACALDFEAGAKYGYATTRPVQEKPDFEKMIEDLVANDMLKLANNIWKNYVELETSRAEGWRKQYYDWKDLLLTTEEENRKLKQEIERLKGIIRYAHDRAYILVNTPKAVKEYCQKDARRLFDKLSEGIESGKTT